MHKKIILTIFLTSIFQAYSMDKLDKLVESIKEELPKSLGYTPFHVFIALGDEGEVYNLLKEKPSLAYRPAYLTLHTVSRRSPLEIAHFYGQDNIAEKFEEILAKQKQERNYSPVYYGHLGQ